MGMARHEDAYVVGMVVPEHSCCYVPFGGDAIPKPEYFVSNSVILVIVRTFFFNNRGNSSKVNVNIKIPVLGICLTKGRPR